MDMVDATPNDVRGLARDLLKGIKALLELNAGVANSLNVLAQTFQDDGYEEYRDSVTRIQQKLEQIAENELDTAVNALVEFANLLEQARSS